MNALEVVPVTEVPVIAREERPAADAPVTTTLKLSEAIRLGSMLKPQGFRCGSARMGARQTCAFGAAQDALGRVIGWDDPLTAIVTTQVCPSCGGRQHSNLAVVIHLNDDHRWTREQIADWVEQFER